MKILAHSEKDIYKRWHNMIWMKRSSVMRNI